MDKYYAMAAEYFNEVEGRSLYPNILSIHWAIWAISISGFGHTIFRFAFDAAMFQPIKVGFAELISWEIAFIASALALHLYKSRKLLESAPGQSSAEDKSLLEKEKLLKTDVLAKICKKKPTQFAATAKEISDLLAYEKASRTILDIDVQDFLRAIYDPDSKARILSLFLAFIALLVTLLKGSELAPLPDLIAEIHKKGGPIVFSVLMLIDVIYVFVIFGGIILGIRQAVFMLSLWASKLGWGQASSRTMLNHMLRDLVMLHAPEEATDLSKSEEKAVLEPDKALQPTSTAPKLRTHWAVSGVLLCGMLACVWCKSANREK